MSNKSRSVIASVSSVQTHSFCGPLPQPTDFGAYEKTLPGASERILAMAERESEFRHESELRKLEITAKQAELATREIELSRLETKRGQLLSFLLTFLAFIAAVVCAWLKQPTVGCIIAGTTLIGVVSAIMKNNKK